MKRVETYMSVSLFLVLAGSLAAGAAQVNPGQPEVKEPALLAAQPFKEDPRDDELQKLMKARYNEALGELQDTYRLYQQNQASLNSWAEASQRLVHAGLELYDKPADKVALLSQYVELTKEVEMVAHTLHGAARGTWADVRRARYQRLDAEIRLLRARREADKARGN